MKPTPIDAYKADDLGDLLSHIAWDDTVRPALLRERDALTTLLVNSTLGLPVQSQTATGPVTVTREQLAGKIYGINYIMKLFENILTRGERAERQLKELGINVG